jgi:hypothetical protein
MSKKHARYSPSTLDNLTKCIRFKYSDMDNDAASEGTELHESFETGITDHLNEEQADCVEQIISYTNSLKVGEGEWIEIKEAKVTLKDLTYGHSDNMLINHTQKMIHVLDAKFTRVDSNHSFQIRTYGAAACEGDPLITDDYDVTTHVVAPRLQLIDVAQYKAGELIKAVREEIEILYARIENPFNLPTPEGSLCAKCARAGDCPAVNKSAMALATTGMSLQLPSTFDPLALTTPVDRAYAQALATALINWGTEVKKANTKAVQEGVDIPGYKMTTRSTGARITKEDTSTAASILRANGYSEDEILGGCKISLNDVAKAHAETSDNPVTREKASIKALMSCISVEGSTSFLQKSNRMSIEEQFKQLQGI